MDRAERPDHKYTIPTYELPIVLELATLEIRSPRNGKSRDSRSVTSQAIRATPAVQRQPPRTATRRLAGHPDADLYWAGIRFGSLQVIRIVGLLATGVRILGRFICFFPSLI